MFKIIIGGAGLASILLMSVVVHSETILFTVNGAGGKAFRGELHLPENRAKPSPVVVMLPGSDGVDQRQDFYRDHLLKAGIGTFVVDIKSGVFTGRRDRPPPKFFIPVGFEAMRVLRARTDVAGKRIAVMGWSFGGAVALRLAHKSYTTEWLKGGEKGFAAHVGLYGGCTRSDKVTLENVPVLVLIGSADTMSDPDRCEIFQGQHHNVALTIYPGAHHGFDKEGVDRNRNGRIMRWDAETATKSRQRIVQFLRNKLRTDSDTK